MTLRSFRRVFGVALPALLAVGSILGTTVAPGAPPAEHEVLFQAFEVDEDGDPEADAAFEATADVRLAPDGDLVVDLHPDDAALFEAFTAARVGWAVELVVDGESVAQPVIREAIPGGTLRVDRGA